MPATHEPPIGAYYRLFAGIPGWSAGDHSRFHSQLFPPGCQPAPPAKVAEHLAILRARSEATQADRDAVAAAAIADPVNCRTLAVMASSCAAGDADFIRERVKERCAELGLTAYALAELTGGAVSQNHIRAYLSGEKSITSGKLKHLLAVLELRIG